MIWWHALLLGAVEGVTEFLPISSTGHLTILESLLGYDIEDPDIVAFTAIIQIGGVLATAVFLRRDIRRVTRAWMAGAINPARRGEDYRFGWAAIVGSVPIGIVGLLFQDHIETTLRSLWVIGGALIVWSVAMLIADRTASQSRQESDATWQDTLIIGLTQCLALVPGVSRSGATISAGLLRGFDRVTVTRLSFFLSIPALSAAGALQDELTDAVARKTAELDVHLREAAAPVDRLSVNLSARQLTDVDLPDRLATIINDAGSTPDRIALEITETAMVDDLKGARLILQRLHAHGFMIMIDDFGSGTSTLQRLADLPVDAVKVDRSLLHGATQEPDRRTVLAAAIGLATQLDKLIIVEGVETIEEARLINDLGADIAQGYYFAIPHAPDRGVLQQRPWDVWGGAALATRPGR